MTLPKSARDLKRLLDEKDADIARLTAERAALWTAYSAAAWRENDWTDQSANKKRSATLRALWAGYTPEQRAARVAVIRARNGAAA